MSSTTETVSPDGALDRYFKITERGSTLAREIRGGFATFFTMAYIVVLNPLIIGTVKDGSGAYLGGGSEPNLAMVATGTAFVAGLMSILMGVVANYPLAIAAGLGLNAFVAFGIAALPTMTWADAMGLVVLEGLLILVLVLTGFRRAVFHAIPAQLKTAISVGIGLFITLVGLFDAGIVRKAPATPVQLGVGGFLAGWPTLVFVVVLIAIIVMMVRGVSGSILYGIVGGTVLAIVVEAMVQVGSQTDASGKEGGEAGQSDKPSASGQQAAKQSAGQSSDAKSAQAKPAGAQPDKKPNGQANGPSQAKNPNS